MLTEEQPIEDHHPRLIEETSLPIADSAIEKILCSVNSVNTNNRLRKKVVPDTALYILNQSHITADLNFKVSDNKCTEIKQTDYSSSEEDLDDRRQQLLTEIAERDKKKREKFGNAHIVYNDADLSDE